MAACFHVLLVITGLLTLSANGQSPLSSAKLSAEEKEALDFVNRAENELHAASKEFTKISWAYASNITEHNEKKQLEFQKKYDQLSLKLGKEAKNHDPNKIVDQDVRRKLESISQIGTSILNEEDLDKYNLIVNDMEKVYSTSKVPDFKNPSKLVSLEPEMTLRFAESRDPKELEYYWTEHRKETGSKIKEMYKDYIHLTNKAAKMNGFRDATEMKTYAYESDTFVQEMDHTWQGLKPLYEQLHAYVRHRLHKFYGDIIDLEGPIPAHLLGNMWAQSWNNIGDMLKPFPDKPSIEVTEEMKNQNWTAKIMFDKADDFFQSIGFEPMTDSFWANREGNTSFNARQTG